jgi:hypothetical protein
LTAPTAAVPAAPAPALLRSRARSLSIQHDLHMRWCSPSNTISTATMNSMFTAAAGVFSQDGAPSQPLNLVVLLLHSGGLNDPQKLFDTIFLQKVIFCSAFELPSLRNIRKRDETKKIEEKLTSKFCRFFWGKFSTWTFCKSIAVVFLNFELPLPRNAQKRT